MSDIEELLDAFRNSKEGMLQSCQHYLRTAQCLMYDYVRDDNLKKLPYKLEMSVNLLNEADSNIDLVLEMLNNEVSNRSTGHSTK